MTFEQFLEFAKKESNLMKMRGKEVSGEFAVGKLLGMWRTFKVASDYTAQEYATFFDKTYMILLNDFI